MQLVDHLALADLGGGEIDGPAIDPDPVLARPFDGPVDSGGFQQFLRRDAAAVQAGAPDLFLFDQSDAQAGQTSVKRGRITPGASPDYHYIKRFGRRYHHLSPSQITLHSRHPARTRRPVEDSAPSGCWPSAVRPGDMLGCVRPPCPRPSKPRYVAKGWAAATVVLATVVWTAAASLPGPGTVASATASKSRGPTVEVVTSAYALAQLTSYIGGKAVHVVNLAPPRPHRRASPSPPQVGPLSGGRRS